MIVLFALCTAVLKIFLILSVPNDYNDNDFKNKTKKYASNSNFNFYNSFNNWILRMSGNESDVYYPRGCPLKSLPISFPIWSNINGNVNKGKNQRFIILKKQCIELYPRRRPSIVSSLPTFSYVRPLSGLQDGRPLAPWQDPCNCRMEGRSRIHCPCSPLVGVF